jgi:hypothetical protein
MHWAKSYIFPLGLEITHKAEAAESYGKQATFQLSISDMNNHNADPLIVR